VLSSHELSTLVLLGALEDEDAALDTIRLDFAAGLSASLPLMRSTATKLKYSTSRDMRAVKGNYVDVSHLWPNASLNSSSLTPMCSQKWTESVS
jgi:hypothetical protein